MEIQTSNSPGHFVNAVPASAMAELLRFIGLNSVWYKAVNRYNCLFCTVLDEVHKIVGGFLAFGFGEDVGERHLLQGVGNCCVEMVVYAGVQCTVELGNFVGRRLRLFDERELDGGEYVVGGDLLRRGSKLVASLGTLQRVYQPGSLQQREDLLQVNF